MTLALRLLLMQMPARLLMAGVLWWAAAQGILQAGTAAAVFVLWLVKDAVLYPAYKHAMRPAPPSGAPALVGEEATVVRALSPRGMVRVHGELWVARPHRKESIGGGVRVRIVGTKGRELQVERVDATRRTLRWWAG